MLLNHMTLILTNPFIFTVLSVTSTFSIPAPSHAEKPANFQPYLPPTKMITTIKTIPSNNKNILYFFNILITMPFHNLQTLSRGHKVACEKFIFHTILLSPICKIKICTHFITNYNAYQILPVIYLL